METTPSAAYDKLFNDMVEDISNREFEHDTTAAAINNLVSLSKVHVDRPEPEPAQPDAPKTRLGKFGAAVARTWDNETTRTLIKAGGSLLGVVVVANATIKKDHVLERQALDQAHQPPAR